MRRAVFLDRDGVLNRATVVAGKPLPPAYLADFEILPGAKLACAKLREAGFLLIVATNQPDVARGTQPRQAVEAMNHALRSQIALDDIKTCYHDDADDCLCRKPLPGLLREAAAEWKIDLAASFMVGDRWKDIDCGRNAGCRTVLIDYDYAEPPSEEILSRPDYRAPSLAEAAEWILNQP